MKKIAVLGYGVVGSGVVELFYRNRAKIEKNTKTELDIAYILDLREFPDDPYGNRVVHDIQTILDDPEVGYVAECIIFDKRTVKQHFFHALRNLFTVNSEKIG